MLSIVFADTDKQMFRDKTFVQKRPYYNGKIVNTRLTVTA